MGAWGYGAFESDNALDIISEILNNIGVTKDKNGNAMIPLANNTVLNGEWTPGLGRLHQVVLQQIIINFDDIVKNIIDKNYSDTGDKTEKAEQYLVLCSLLHEHEMDIPNKSAKKALKSISYLLKEDCKDTNSYDSPASRRRIIKKVTAKIEDQINHSTNLTTSIKHKV